MDDYKQQAQDRIAEEVGDTKRGLYKHYKGGLYVLFSESVDEATGDVLVHYYSLEKRTRWTRKLEVFFDDEFVIDDGCGGTLAVERFKFLRTALPDELFQAAFDNGEG